MGNKKQKGGEAVKSVIEFRKRERENRKVRRQRGGCCTSVRVPKNGFFLVGCVPKPVFCVFWKIEPF